MERRTAAREHLLPFTEYTFHKFAPSEHHVIIAKELEDVEAGICDRLIITAPPRHTKSELASRRFPAWCLGRHPEWDFIGASYNVDLARDFGTEVRDIMLDEYYQTLFETRLRSDIKAGGRWKTQDGGMYIAAGPGTATTGRGAMVFMIDDPVKDREEADSELQREKTWKWFTSVAYTRLAPGGRIVIILTRWHDDDLVGRCLEREKFGGDKWRVVDLKAVCEDPESDPLHRHKGRALWPSWFPEPVLDRIKRNIGEREWSALYQQKPSPDEGIYFKRAWFDRYESRPPNDELRIYGASDWALTEDETNDPLVHMVWGVDQNEELWALDLFRDWLEVEYDDPEKTGGIGEFIRMVKKWKPLSWGFEKGQIDRSIGPAVEREMRIARAYCNVVRFPTTADKIARARSFQAICSMRMVHIPARAVWAPDFMEELLKFPTTKHDDQVDACSLIGLMLAQLAKGKAPQPPKRVIDDVPTYEDMMNKHDLAWGKRFTVEDGLI